MRGAWIRMIAVWMIAMALCSGAFAETMDTNAADGDPEIKMYMENGEPAQSSHGCYGEARFFSGGVCVEIDCLNADGELMTNTAGYAVRKQETDAVGNVTRIMYYGADRTPAALSKGHYGVLRGPFDAEGRYLAQTYLDINGDPANRSDGYATVKYQYNAAGKKSEERFYDVSGAPAQRGNGVYGVRYEYDEEDRTVRETYLGADGEVTVTDAGYASIRREYDGERLKYLWYCDAGGEKMDIGGGTYGKLYRYNAAGERIVSCAVGKNGHEIVRPDLYLQERPWLVVAGMIAVMVAAAVLPAWAVLAAYTVFILYMTLLSRGTEQGSQLVLRLFASVSRAIADPDPRQGWLQIFNNIALFVPFGFALRLLLRRKICFLIPAIFSVLIEGTQLLLGLGWCETDDVLWNALGGAIGIWMAMALLKKRRQRYATVVITAHQGISDQNGGGDQIGG